MDLKTCIVVEDEPLARQQIENYISEIDTLELKGSFSNGLEAQKFLMNNQIDFCFLDIEMPKLNGMELAKRLKEQKNECKIIFTTAYANFAAESYDVQAIDYLLKPLSKKKFANRVERILSEEQNMDKASLEHIQQEFLFVKTSYQIKKIALKDILYFEGLKDYIQIFTKNEKHPVLILSNFKNILKKLPEEQFMRVHRSYIVNLKKVEIVEKNRIIFGEKFIPISETYKDHFFEFLDDFLL